MLSARGIKKSFGTVEALKETDITVNPGKITILVGPSGSGKSTLVRCLSFLERPDAGTIRFNGHSFHYPQDKSSFKDLPWPELTVVFQQHFLWPHLTIRENILLPLNHSKEWDHTEFDDLVKSFEMDGFLDRHPNQVSLGQRQRAALLRALMLHPKIILMDEVTSALDVEQIGKIAQLLVSLRERGIGMLLITHLIDFARHLLLQSEYDSIAFLDRGEIIEFGGIDVLNSPSHPRVREFIRQSDFSLDKSKVTLS